MAGSLACFMLFGQLSVGYWLGREFWGPGIATRALAEFVRLLPERPLFARAAKDNLASIRVLQKCGFEWAGEERGFAHARGKEIDEVILRLGQMDEDGNRQGICGSVGVPDRDRLWKIGELLCGWEEDRSGCLVKQARVSL